MKTFKNITLGIVIGIIISSSFTVFGADIIRNTYFNSNLKLTINNHQVPDIRIVTVELEGEKYGRNYYSIADLIKALNDYGGISAKVDFDSVTKTTIVEIGETVTKNVYNEPLTETNVNPTPTPTIPTISPTQEAIVSEDVITNISNFATNENGEETFIANNIKYITDESVTKYIHKSDKDLVIFVMVDNKSFIRQRTNILNIALDDIPTYKYLNQYGSTSYCFKYEDYINIIVPFVKGWTE
jgi:hypothetical protein